MDQKHWLLVTAFLFDVDWHFEGELGDANVGGDFNGVNAIEAGAAELVLLDADGFGDAVQTQVAERSRADHLPDVFNGMVRGN